jgi:hypothetical protein
MSASFHSSPSTPAPTPLGPVVDPANWRGPMLKDDDWVFRLEDGDIVELEAAGRRIQQKGTPIAAITKKDFPLPLLGEKLQAIRRQLKEGLGFVMLRGLPIDRYTHEPSATLYWGISQHIGKVVPANNEGHLVSHVVNLGRSIANPNEQSTYSKDTFSYHTDECDIVGLLCLHPSKSGGASTLASAIAIHNAIQEVRPDLLKELYQPFFIDRRTFVPEGAQPWYQMPVFTWHERRLLVWLQPGFTESCQRFEQVPRLTQKQRDALQMMQTLADNPCSRLDMTFGKGDIQFLNNHVVVHSRTAFEDYPEQERRRHLLRLMLVAPEVRELSPWHTGPMARTPGSRGGIYPKDVEPHITLDPA